jgi:hypothetical protein
VAKFLVRGGTPMVGVDEQATRGGEGGDGLLQVSSTPFRVEQREQEGVRS